MRGEMSTVLAEKTRRKEKLEEDLGIYGRKILK
jgi:hypothetical protein